MIVAGGGIDLRPVKPRYPGDLPSVCDYGAYLEEVGSEAFYDNTMEAKVCRAHHPAAGDIAIFMPIMAEEKNSFTISMHKHGHIQMFDSKVWIFRFPTGRIF
ncbi:MAG TPA: hypothetical protein VFK49_02810, partial [Stellaceae bacterium]|nr:hypothetical protein [Stellaceae bacterium]